MYTGTLGVVSNEQSFEFIAEVMDVDDEDSPVDLTGYDIVFELRNQRTKCTSLSATTDDGSITIIDTGVFRVFFTREQMQALDPQTHDVGCVLTLNDETVQLIAATVGVIDGIVSQ